MTPKRVQSVRIDDGRLALVRRRQAIDVRFGGPRCAVDGAASPFALRPSDVEILNVMAREGDPLGGGAAQRTAFAALARVDTLDSAEALVRAAQDPAVHPGLRANALVALQQVSPVLAGSLAGQLLKDGDGVVRQAAGGVLQRVRSGDGAAAKARPARTRPPSAARVRAAKRIPRTDRSGS
jgi:hypothetical protein